MSAAILLVSIPENFKLEDVEKEVIYENLDDLEEDEEDEAIKELRELIKNLKNYGHIEKDDSNYFGILFGIFQESELNLVIKRIDVGGWDSVIINIRSILEEYKK